MKVIHSAGIRQGRELLGDLDESETGAENGDERRRREVSARGHVPSGALATTARLTTSSIPEGGDQAQELSLVLRLMVRIVEDLDAAFECDDCDTHCHNQVGPVLP